VRRGGAGKQAEECSVRQPREQVKIDSTQQRRSWAGPRCRVEKVQLRMAQRPSCSLRGGRQGPRHRPQARAVLS